jgi:Ser/Thr protein kinase RdoA (MazF antagonist)
MTPADVRLIPARGGHINASFLVADGNDAPRWLLQRVNRSVCPSPELVMHNIEMVLTGAAAGPISDISLPTLLRTADGDRWVHDADGELWRCWVVAPGLRSMARVTSVQDAREAGRAFGAFARIATTLDAGLLAETIPGFHDTPARLSRLEMSIAHNTRGRVDRAREEIALALRHRALAPLLVAPLRSGAIPARVAHNDAKIANVLFEAATGRAAMVIDLDTVMPGTPLFDFGDLVRSSVSRAAEDSTDLTQVEAEPELYGAVLEGYLSGAGGLLTPAERALLEPAGRVITWEQAIRFLTDYIDGDIYFATTHRDHNLERARAQLALLSSLEEKREEFGALSRQSSVGGRQ